MNDMGRNNDRMHPDNACRASKGINSTNYIGATIALSKPNLHQGQSDFAGIIASGFTQINLSLLIFLHEIKMILRMNKQLP